MTSGNSFKSLEKPGKSQGLRRPPIRTPQTPFKAPRKAKNWPAKDGLDLGKVGCDAAVQPGFESLAPPTTRQYSPRILILPGEPATVIDLCTS